MCVKMCVCAHVNGLKRAWQWEWPDKIKVYNFQMDSQTCTRFIGKVCHELKDS